MIFETYIGAPIKDYSVDGCATETRFYLISFFNKPYRVIYTRYPYNYLKRLTRRFMRGQIKETSLLCLNDAIDTFCPPMPRWLYSSLFTIQPVYVECYNNEEIKSLTKDRIRKIINTLEVYYMIKPFSSLS